MCTSPVKYETHQALA